MKMKKFINDPTKLTVELLEGLALAYPENVKLVNERIVVRAKPKATDKVAVITLGGTGHEPALSGFVGCGLLDASVAGDVFAAPGAPKLFEAIEMFKRDAGIVLVTLNHNGDRMSANKAIRMAQKAGIKIEEIVVHEDIAQGVNTDPEDKRGLGGSVQVIKVVGAAAEAGKSLEECVAIGNRFNDGIATLSVAVRGCTHPQNGGEIAVLDDDEMEIGMGQHGEAGGGRSALLTADETADKMLAPLIEACKLSSGDRAMLVINGSGATTPMEMLIVFRRAAMQLAAQGISVAKGMADEILTVQEMAGFQMTIAKLDEETEAMLKAPCNSPYWKEV